MNNETDRDRRHTAKTVLQRIDDETAACLHEYADAPAGRITERLSELDREWDMDRAIELESSMMGLFGLALGAFVSRTFLAVPAAVGAAVFLHALIGWYPLLPAFRRMGLRTAREIARERYALKALRGDFSGMEADNRHAAVTEAASPSSTTAVH
jgi:hypothetical protein